MTHPVDVHVGKRIRHRRWLTGMTQQQLGDQVGIKFQQVQKYETGVNRVSASRLWDIANAQGVPIAYYFKGLKETETTGEPESDIPAEFMRSKEALELVRAYFAMPESHRRQLYELARVLGAQD